MGNVELGDTPGDTLKLKYDTPMDETYEDLIELARENGLRDIADTIEYLLDTTDPLAVEPDEYSATGDLAFCFRSGVVWGIENERSETGRSKPNDREAFVSSLLSNGKTRLADAFDYCWANSEEVTSNDFDVTELPIEGDRLGAFSIGMSVGMTLERREKK
jgi:hypothetical protein